MSDMSNLDDFTRKQLGNYSPEVPPHVWDNIVAKRERKKPYPFLIKFFNGKNLLLTAGLITLLTASIFISNNYKTVADNKNEVKESPINEKKKEAATNTLNKQQNNLPSAKNSIEDNINNKEFNPIENISGNPEIPVPNNNNDNKNNNSSTSSTNTFFQKNGSQNKLVVSNGRDKHLYKKGTVNINSSMEDAEEFNVETIISLNKKNEENKIEDVSLLNLQLYYPEKITSGALKTMAENKNTLPHLLLPPCPVIERNAAGNKYYIEVYAGPDYAFKSFSDTANSVLLQKRKESTSFRSAFSAGFRYTRVFNNGASIRAGVNYSQINEKFSYVQSNIVQVTYITDPVTGDTTGTFLTRGSRYKTTNNRYHTIDIPLLLGFETGNGRLHANFNAGVVLNIYSWQKGESLDTSFRPVSITTGKSASLYQYKTNIGAGFMGGISVYYKLNERLHLLAEPYWRYNFSPMNKEMLSLQEKFSTIGLRLGVRWDLY